MWITLDVGEGVVASVVRGPAEYSALEGKRPSENERDLRHAPRSKRSVRAHTVVAGGESVAGYQVEHSCDDKVGDAGLCAKQGHRGNDRADERTKDDECGDRLAGKGRL